MPSLEILLFHFYIIYIIFKFVCEDVGNPFFISKRWLGIEWIQLLKKIAYKEIPFCRVFAKADGHVDRWWRVPEFTNFEVDERRNRSVSAWVMVSRKFTCITKHGSFLTIYMDPHSLMPPCLEFRLFPCVHCNGEPSLWPFPNQWGQFCYRSWKLRDINMTVPMRNEVPYCWYELKGF